MQRVKTIAVFLFFGISQSYALPIDWKGEFGVNTTLIDTYRFMDQPKSEPSSTDPQAENFIVPATDGKDKDASFQSYIFKLRPSIIVNDSASVFAELSTGYGYGGELGDSSAQSKDGSNGNSRYFYNTSASNQALNVRQLYMDLYSDTGTYRIGRQSFNWGLGAIYNSGKELWSRHNTIRDGISMNYKIGHFLINPYYYKIDLTNGKTKLNNAKELGLALYYDNPERDLSFGILFGKKISKQHNNFFQSDIGGTNGGTRNLQKTEVKITDIFLKKTWGDFTIAVEAPILSGELGSVYSDTISSNYKANAVIGESSYVYDHHWTFGLDAGWMTGDDGETGTFKAMYLHPNYNIAHLMHHYNLSAIANSAESMYDSSLTNMTFVKLHTSYVNGKWNWKLAYILAMAEETAKNGNQAFNHQKNLTFNSTAQQEDDYGHEIDLSFDYDWNDNVKISGDLGYFMVGDYYSFNNTSSPESVSNSYVFVLKSSVNF